jgi:hypothetical protein
MKRTAILLYLIGVATLSNSVEPGSGTYAQDSYKEKLSMNQSIEAEFGEMCPTRYTESQRIGDKYRDSKFDAVCLWLKSNMKYERSIHIYKDAAEDEIKWIKQQAIWKKEDARLSKLPGVRIGMTSSDVLNKSNWGRPESINRTTTSAGSREQWIYGSRNYLYFNNGILTAIQN